MGQPGSFVTSVKGLRPGYLKCKCKKGAECKIDFNIKGGWFYFHIKKGIGFLVLLLHDNTLQEHGPCLADTVQNGSRGRFFWSCVGMTRRNRKSLSYNNLCTFLNLETYTVIADKLNKDK